MFLLYYGHSLWVQISLFLFLFFYYEYGVFWGEGSDLFDPYQQSWTRSIPGQFLDNKDEMWWSNINFHGNHPFLLHSIFKGV